MIELLRPTHVLSAVEELPQLLRETTGIRLVAFDVDGTLTEHHATLDEPVARTLTKLGAAGLDRCVISNAYGERVKELDAMFTPFGMPVFTPAKVAPPGKRPTSCRKPSPLMIQRAAADHGVDPAEVLMVGDQIFKDVLSARRVGAQSLLVPRRGPGDDLKVRLLQRPPEALVRVALGIRFPSNSHYTDGFAILKADMHEQMKVDTTPLSSAVSLREAYRACWATRKSKIDAVAATIVLAIPSAIVALAASAYLNASDLGGPVRLITAAVIFLAIMVGVARLPTKYCRSVVRLQRFADANHAAITFDRAASSDQPGKIFQRPGSQNYHTKIEFPDSTVFGEYSYLIGQSHSARRLRWVYARFRLPQHMPNILLDSRSNDYFGVFSDLADFVNPSQKLQLDGDFKKFFTVYAPQGYEADARHILTPDIMQVLKTHAAAYDVELIDNYLYVYKKRIPRFGCDNPQVVDDILKAGSAVAGHIARRNDYASRYNERRALEMAQDTGRRLRSRFGLGVASLAWFLIPLVIIAISIIIYDALVSR